LEANRVSNFINFILEETEENNKIIDEELKEAGLNTEKFQKKMLNIISDSEKQQKIENGRKLKILYQKLKQKIKDETSELSNSGLQLAFRNFENDLSEKEKQSIIKDDMLLDKIAKELKKNEE
jgi:hypothetical protein